MLSTALVLLVAASAGGELVVPAHLSGPPALCAPSVADSGAGGGPSPWNQVRERGRREVCARLARVQRELGHQPQLALRLAREMAREVPELPEPLALAARAASRSGAYAEALPLWDAARDRGYDFRSAPALRDYAITAAMTGHSEVAADAYRRASRLIDAWPDPLDRQALLVEAALAAMRARPEQLDEASAYLDRARAAATSTGLRAHAAGVAALLAKRRGTEAAVASTLDAPEIWYFVERVQQESWPPHWPVVPRHELYGAASLLVEPYSATVAAELWQRHLQGLERGQEPKRERRAR